MKLLVVLAAIFVTSNSEFTYCEPAATIGEVDFVFNRCPPGYTAASNGWCCATDYIKYTRCVDVPNRNGENECPGLKQYCNHSLFKDTMINNCAKTCGFCT